MEQENYSIVFSSSTGNTKKLADAVYEILPKDIKWHMIGHLQRNKVKYLMGKVALIHSGKKQNSVFQRKKHWHWLPLPQNFRISM